MPIAYKKHDYILMSCAIKVENLGKKYIIQHQQQSRYQYNSLGESLSRGLRNLGKNLLHPFQGDASFENTEEFWALKDINFEIKHGDRVGIIGRNGAGKSTLLKILSRITHPSTGKITINGRVSSLLEVGTGFHPELTGRENIFLNGAILGMRKQEIKRKFDEIVDFAEVERFLDTPVKHYSSGMYIRLAFAVAAHLESETLLIDEVLAVGDANFQKKCLGKMTDVSKDEGRTVLFVSHNMNAIQSFCNRALLLEKGAINAQSENVRQVTLTYLGLDKITKTVWENPSPEKLKHAVVPIRVSITDKNGKLITGSISNNEQAYFNLELEIHTSDPSLTLGYALYTEDGQLLYWTYQSDQKQSNWPVFTVGRAIFRSPLPIHFLNEGNYQLEHISSLHCREWIIAPGTGPTVMLSIQGGLSESPLWQVRRPGILAPIIPWKSNQ